MRRGHLRKRPHHRHRDTRSAGKAENHCRTRELYGNGAAEKQSRPDGAAQPDHGDLPWREVLVEACFAFNNRRGISR